MKKDIVTVAIKKQWLDGKTFTTEVLKDYGYANLVKIKLFVLFKNYPERLPWPKKRLLKMKGG